MINRLSLANNFIFQKVTVENIEKDGNIIGYSVFYNEKMEDVNSSTTSFLFDTAKLNFPPQPVGFHSLIITATVAARSRYGVGPRSEPPETTEINGMYIWVHSSLITSFCIIYRSFECCRHNFQFK